MTKIFNYYGTDIEVSEDIYQFLLRDAWKQKKRRERSTRCIIEGGKRCDEPCSECPYTRSGGDFSVEQMEEIGLEIRSGESPVEDIVIENETHEKLKIEFDTLSPVDRGILELKYEGLSDERIAEILGMKQTSVSRRKRKLISELLGRYGDEI